MATPAELMGHSLVAPLARDLGTNAINAITIPDLINATTKGQNYVVYTPLTLTANLTLTGELQFLKTGKFTTNGFTLTINGPLSAGAAQIFATSGTQVVLGPNSTNYVLAEWFGALGDGSTDDTTAIQVALNVATVARVPLVLMCKKTYRISAITMPQYGRIICENARRSYAVLKANSASAMVTLSPTGDDFNELRGIQFDGNSTAVSCLKLNATNYPTIENCAFVGAVKLVDSTLGVTGANFIRCEFNGTTAVTTDCVFISGASIGLYFDKCTFGNTATYAIRSDSSFTGDNINIVDNSFGCVCTDMIKLDRDSGGGAHVNSVIARNRFDGGPINSNINIGRYTNVVIRDNEITGGSTYSIVTDGLFTQIEANAFTQSTTAGIAVTANAQDVYIGKQMWGALGGGVYISDAGTRTIIEPQQEIRSGTTAQRPASGLSAAHLLSTQHWGPYFDTTLDADGKAIWWNGTAWVDATGAVV